MIAALEPGDQLGGYRIDRLAARTGMALIYSGTDMRTQMPVAIKVPAPSAGRDRSSLRLFQTEVLITRKMDHPRVVKVMDDGAEKRPYLVMEWMEGRLLRQVLDEEGKLPAHRAIKITLGICDALDHIHANGVVHRDLKPENVMVDAQDCVKLFDFGIASLAGMSRLMLSKFMDTMGTPDYISPEQLTGKPGDKQSDLYALGVMLYEMLTGQVPFTGSNPLAIMNDRLLNDPVPPRDIDPTISPELQRIVRRAMERDPRNRYTSVPELAWDLHQLDRGGGTERSESQKRQRWRFARPKRTWSFLLLTMIPLVIFKLLLIMARQR